MWVLHGNKRGGGASHAKVGVTHRHTNAHMFLHIGPLSPPSPPFFWHAADLCIFFFILHSARLLAACCNGIKTINTKVSLVLKHAWNLVPEVLQRLILFVFYLFCFFLGWGGRNFRKISSTSCPFVPRTFLCHTCWSSNPRALRGQTVTVNVWNQLCALKRDLSHDRVSF